MPAYNISVRAASHIANTASLERANLADLRVEMARFVGELLKDHAAEIWEDQDWKVDVTDDTGLILYVLHVSATETSATKGSVSRD